MRKTICRRTYRFEGRRRQAAKINTTLFVGVEVLNIFYLTVFSKKKNNIFQNKSKKLFSGGMISFYGKGASDYKNEYNLFFGK